MEKKKVLVLGYFGFENNQLDGQTVKTRNLFKLIESKRSNFKKIEYFDTQTFQNNKFNLIKLFRLLAKIDLLFYLPAHKNLKYIFPFIFIFSKFKNFKIHYVVVGGWLSKYLRNKPLHQWMLSRISGIYPENKKHVDDLKYKYHLTNVYQLNNFRVVDVPFLKFHYSEMVRMVFLARVHPLKGVNTLFKLAERITVENIQNIKIDIYGPVFSEYSNEFNTLLADQKLISYHGVLQPNEIYNTLMNYDLMLFPTQYFTEGFPGSVLDSYIAHVPVIATEWKYAEEFIEDKISGVIVKFGDDVEFINETLKLIRNPDHLKQLKLGAIAQSKKYSAESAWRTLKTAL